MEVAFAKGFRRQFRKLEPALQEECLERIELFEADHTNPSLKTHKLHGRLKDRWSFSVNYKIRIVFMYETKNRAVLLAVGSHDVYDV